MAAAESAHRDIEAAEADAGRAERAITREREELERLRRAAEREKEALEEAETAAAGDVRAAAAGVPEVALPGGIASPPAMAGTSAVPFSRLTPAQRGMLASGREWEADQRQAAERAEEENEGNAGDGLGKAWGDVKDEVGGLAGGAFNHVNVFNGDKFKETWGNDLETGKAIWNDPLGAAEQAVKGTFAPLGESYESGGFDEALGRTPGVLAGVFGGKGLTKLDELNAPDPAAGDRPSWGQSESDVEDRLGEG